MVLCVDYLVLVDRIASWLMVLVLVTVFASRSLNSVRATVVGILIFVSSITIVILTLG